MNKVDDTLLKLLLINAIQKIHIKRKLLFDMEIKPIKSGSVFHVAYLLRPTEASLLEVTGEGFNLKCCSLPNVLKRQN